MSWRRVFYWFGLALGFSLFGYQLWEAVATVRNEPVAFVAPWLLVGVLALNVLAYLLLMAGWAVLMQAVGVAMPLRPIAQGYLLSFLPRYIPGTVWGYLSRSEWLAQRYNVPYGRSSTASLLEIAMQVLTAAAITVLCAAPGVWRWVAMPAVLAASALAWRCGPRFLLSRRGGREVPVANNWSLWLLCLLIYAAFWITHGFATWLVAAALGAGGALTLASASFAFSASWLVGFVFVFVPAGLGVREWSMVAILERTTTLAPWQPPVIAVTGRLAIVAAELLLLLLGLSLYAADWLRARSKDTRHDLVK